MPGTNMPNFWIDYDIFADDPEYKDIETPKELQEWTGEHLPWNEASVIKVQRSGWKKEINGILQYLMHMERMN